MWAWIFLLSCFSVTHTLACEGCHIVEKDTDISYCDEKSAELLELKCEQFQISPECEVISKCVKHFRKPIHSAEISIKGTVAQKSFEWHEDDFCKSLKNKEFDGKPVGEFLHFYGFPESCEDWGKSDHVGRNRTLNKMARNSLRQGAGQTEIEMRLLNVNGEKGVDACIRIKSTLVCVKPTRKSKSE